MTDTSPPTSLPLLDRLRGGDDDAWRRCLLLIPPLLAAWLVEVGL